MENLSKEQIEKSINAAFDSVNLIEMLNNKQNLDENEIASKNRNIEHLKLMLSKEWFTSNLTSEQKTEIENIIN